MRAARNSASVGARLTAAQAMIASAAPTLRRRGAPSASMRRRIASEATMATLAETERACPTAATDAPRSLPIATVVGDSVTSSPWEAIVASTSGASFGSSPATLAASIGGRVSIAAR